MVHECYDPNSIYGSFSFVYCPISGLRVTGLKIHGSDDIAFALISKIALFGMLLAAPHPSMANRKKLILQNSNCVFLYNRMPPQADVSDAIQASFTCLNPPTPLGSTGVGDVIWSSAPPVVLPMARLSSHYGPPPPLVPPMSEVRLWLLGDPFFRPHFQTPPKSPQGHSLTPKTSPRPPK